MENQLVSEDLHIFWPNYQPLTKPTIFLKNEKLIRGRENPNPKCASRNTKMIQVIKLNDLRVNDFVFLFCFVT